MGRLANRSKLHLIGFISVTTSKFKMSHEKYVLLFTEKDFDVKIPKYLGFMTLI